MPGSGRTWSGGRNADRWFRPPFGARSARSARDLAHDKRRILASIEALVRRLPDHSVRRPAGELGPDDELGPNPDHAIRDPLRRRRIEGRPIGLELGKQLEQLASLRAAKARADPSGIAQLPALVDADE